MSLADIMLRRTMLAMDADAGFGMAESMSFVAQELYGWSDEQRETELAEFHRQIGKQLPKNA